MGAVGACIALRISVGTRNFLEFYCFCVAFFPMRPNPSFEFLPLVSLYVNAIGHISYPLPFVSSFYLTFNNHKSFKGYQLGQSRMQVCASHSTTINLLKATNLGK